MPIGPCCQPSASARYAVFAEWHHYRMTPQRALKMPDWPARMGEDMAALYLGVSASTLRAGSASGRYPKPVRDGKRVLYARCQLDRFVRAQFGLPVTDGEQEGRGWAA